MEKFTRKSGNLPLNYDRLVELAEQIRLAPKHRASMLSAMDIDILAQPDDTTCGPTCLHGVYRFYGDDIDLKTVIEEVHAFEGGGTLAVWLGCHALKRGYEAMIYTYDLQLFDPTWFMDGCDIREKLETQLLYKSEPKFIVGTNAYLEFLALGGEVKFDDLDRNLIRDFLKQQIPILTGLNYNYLYRVPREITYFQDNKPALLYDDIKGVPGGHFVVLLGYDRKNKHVIVGDPYEKNPYSATRRYDIHIDRVICAILLGITTYDANFLIIRPKREKA